MTRIASPVRTRASQTQILVNNYFDSVQAEFVQGNHVITVENGLILSVLKESEVPYRKRAPENPDVIDLRGTTVLPGFVDTHVHMFLHPYEEASWSNQLTRESLPERTIRGVKHARDTLLAGFTTVRDLGTEGASDADFALRKCISSPLSLVPGPRYFCSSRAIVTTGSYGPKLELYPGREGVDGVTGAQAADGPDECMKAVRQQVGAGADWIKVYSGKIRLTHTPILFPTKLSPLDYSHQYRISQTSPTAGARPIPLWTKPEWDSLVSTAHSLGVKVASHANTPTGALAALEAGASTLEHGYDYNQEVFDKLRETRAFWNPTLSVFSLEPDSPKWPKLKQAVQAALKENEQVGWDKDRIIRITCGGDTGPFAHGTNALELQLLHSLGMPARRVLQAATHLGWECVRGMAWDSAAGAIRLRAYLEDPAPLGDNEVPFGSIEPGFAADLIATTGDLVGNNEQGFAEAVSADKIVFVMKAGKMYKSGGEPVL